MMSRLTFREPAGRVAWQKQLRDRYISEGVPPVPHLDVKRAIVRPVSRRIAEQVILKYEWLGTMAAGAGHFYGIFFGSYCAGVCCVGVGSGGANINAHMQWKIERNELAYLARGACVHWSPTGANSKLVSWTCKLLARDTAAKLIIAYSDADAGEIGTIYQACNWTYVGRGSPTVQWIAPNGRVYDYKHPSNLKSRQKGKFPRRTYLNLLRQEGWKEQKSNPKGRYVYVLDKSDKRLVALVESMRQPYPKRAAEVTPGDTATFPVDEGGSRPTRPLMIDEAQLVE